MLWQVIEIILYVLVIVWCLELLWLLIAGVLDDLRNKSKEE